MHRSFLLTSCVLFSAMASGCGSLAGDTDQHEPLAVLHGELSNPNAIRTSNLRFAVIWACGSIEGDMNLVTQDVAVQLDPALRFRLELTEPPPANCMLAQRGIGAIAAYDDLNRNGKLDDPVVGTNQFLSLVYFEGLAEDDRDSDGNLPSLGYNLQAEVREAYELEALCNGSNGLMPTASNPNARDGDEPQLKWMDAGTIFTLTMTQCDGTPDNDCNSYTHDAHGNKLTEQWDEDCDGTPEISICYAYTYDANGNKLTEQVDDDCDGKPNRRTSWTYYGNGTPEQCTSYTYDANGNLLSEQEDRGCDGTPDWHCNSYTYDANGNRLTGREDWDCNGTPESCYAYTYDANGNMLTGQADWNCDGTPGW